jgi:hypothetical protein
LTRAHLGDAQRLDAAGQFGGQAHRPRRDRDHPDLGRRAAGRARRVAAGLAAAGEQGRCEQHRRPAGRPRHGGAHGAMGHRRN